MEKYLEKVEVRGKALSKLGLEVIFDILLTFSCRKNMVYAISYFVVMNIFVKLGGQNIFHPSMLN